MDREVESDIKRVDIWPVLKEIYGDNAIDFLEIGVYKAGRILSGQDVLKFNSYTGVDPYFGDKSDYYLGGYWNNELDAFEIYRESANVYKRLGADLYKTTSALFYHSLDKNKFYDVIFIDGDHRYFSALSDMCNWYNKTKIGGCLVVDDYGNTDCPEVTAAVNRFISIFSDYIDHVYSNTFQFKNAGKWIPITNTRVFIFKARDIDIVLDEHTDESSTTGSIIHLNDIENEIIYKNNWVIGSINEEPEIQTF